MTQLNDLYLRLWALLSSWLTWLTIACAVLVELSHQLNGIAGIPKSYTILLARAIVILTAVITQVRTHQKSTSAGRGLLNADPILVADPTRSSDKVTVLVPQKGPGGPTPVDQGLALIELLVGGVILILFYYFIVVRR